MAEGLDLNGVEGLRLDVARGGGGGAGLVGDALAPF